MAEKILIEYEVELGKVKAQMVELQTQMKETEKAGKDSAKGVTNEFAKTETQAKSLKAQLRELKAQLASATDPKEVERLAKAAGKLTDQIQDATEAAKVFASESKFEQVGTAIGGIGRKLLSLDFKGALDQSRLLLSVSQTITFKEALTGVKDLFSTITNLGKSLVTNPLFLLGTVVYAAISAFNSFSEATQRLTQFQNDNADALKRVKDETNGIISATDQLQIQYDVQQKKITQTEGKRLEARKKYDSEILKVTQKFESEKKAVEDRYVKLREEDGFRASKNLVEAFGVELDETEEKNKALKALNEEEARAKKALVEQYSISLKLSYGEELIAAKEKNKEIKKESKALYDYEKILRDLRVQNIADNYEREKAIIENKFADEQLKYKGQNDIVVELEKSKNFELAELNSKYNKTQIQNVDKLIGYLNESRTGEVETQMVLKDMSIGLTTEKTKEEIELERQKAEEIKRIQSELFGFSSRLIGDIANIRQNQISSEINMLDEQYSTQRDNIQASFESQLISREEYDKQVADLDKKASEEKAKLQREAFIAQKNASYIQAAISTAQGIANALTVQPATLVPFYLALAAATGAAQLAVIASQPVPKFAKGGEIGGRLHSEGGTLIEAEKGEYVINRKSSMQNREMLTAINKGLADKYIFENYIAPALRHQTKEFENSKNKSFADSIASSMILNSGQFKDTNIIDALKTNRMSEKENFNKLISAIKSGSKNIRDIV